MPGLIKRMAGMKWKAAGSLLGLGLGPFGLVFGALVGHLVDIALSSMRLRRDVRNYLADPIAHPVAAGACAPLSLYVLALLTRGTASRSDSAYLREAVGARFRLSLGQRRTFAALVEQLGEVDDPLHPWAAESSQSIRRLADIHAEALYARLSYEERVASLTDLYRLSAAGRGRIGATPRMILHALAHVWALPSGAVAGIEADYAGAEADPWVILGLRRGSEPAELKRVYRLLASHFHPDKAAQLSDVQRRESEEAFRRIKRAYETCLSRGSA